MQLEVGYTYLNCDGQAYLITDADPGNGSWPMFGYRIPLDGAWVANEMSWSRNGRAGDPLKHSSDDLHPIAAYPPDHQITRDCVTVLSKCRRMTTRLQWVA